MGMAASYARCGVRLRGIHSAAYFCVCWPAYQRDLSVHLWQIKFFAHFSSAAYSVLATGLRQMPEAERLSTLRLLDANRAEVEAKIATLPIIIETPSMVRTEHVV